MTYDDYINNIKTTRGQWSIPNGVFFEPHHILPICKGGEPENYDKRKMEHHDNIIFLLPHEHREAHRLLYLENKSDPQLANAYHCLAHMHDGEELTDEEFDLAREANSTWARSQKVQEGKYKYTNGTKSIFCFEGEQPEGWYRGADENWSNNISKALTGKKMAADDPRRKILSEAHKGKPSATANKRQINNGVKHKFVDECELDYWVSQGWNVGQIKPSKETIKKLKDKAKKREERKRGCKWFNNGIKNVQALECPEGYTPGMVKRKTGK